MKKILLGTLLLILLGAVFPLGGVAHAQKPTERPPETTYEQAYVPCGTIDVNDSAGNPVSKTITLPDGITRTVYGDGVVDNPCQFTHVILFAKKLIMGWIIFGIIFSTLGFAYAGLLYVTAMGAQEKISHAHSIFVKTFWGFFFMLSAWLIAYTMEKIFLTPESLGRSFLESGSNQ